LAALVEAPPCIEFGETRANAQVKDISHDKADTDLENLGRSPVDWIVESDQRGEHTIGR
jgi:hypothetical protein